MDKLVPAAAAPAPIFPGTCGPASANILIVGEAYGSEEKLRNRPFVGTSGRELSRMLAEAGLDLDRCYLTNVVNKQPPGNDFTHFLLDTESARKSKVPDLWGLYPREELVNGLRELDRLINHLRPRLIIAAGNWPLWAIGCGQWGGIGNSKQPKGYKLPTGIGNWRGSMLVDPRQGGAVLPIYHPASILRSWEDRQITVADLKRRVPMALNNLWAEPPVQFTFPRSRDDFDMLMSALVDLYARICRAPTLLPVDIETRQRLIECVGIAWSDREALCVPFMTADENNKEGYWTLEQEVILTNFVRRILEHPNAKIVGQNFFYDIQYLRYYLGVKCNYKYDTMLAQHVMYPGTPLGLDYLSSVYCDHHVFWKEDGKDAAAVGDDNKRWEYNCRDCVKTYEIINKQVGAIKSLNLSWQFAFQLMRARLTAGAGPANAAMMVRGVRTDPQWRVNEAAALYEARSQIEAALYEIMPEGFIPPQGKNAAPWWRSNKQLDELFYITLGCKPILDRKTGQRTTNDAALVRIGNVYPELKPLCELLSKYRSLQVFDNFVHMPLGPDQRVRCSYSPTTETFRYRSSADVFGYGSNLQNIPKGAEDYE